MFKMVAERYAEALYQTAKDAGIKNPVSGDIKILENIFDKLPEVRKYCLSERASEADAVSLVEVAFLPFLKTDECRNTVKLMAENMRLASMPFLIEAYSQISDKYNNRIRAVANFANTPDPEIIERIRKFLAARTGKKVDIEQKVTPELLGGYVLSWKNRMIDDSIKGRIKQLQKSLAVK